VGISGAPEGVGFLSGDCPNQFPVEALSGREVEAAESLGSGIGARRGCDQRESNVRGNLEHVQRTSVAPQAEINQGFESISRTERARKKTVRNLAQNAARQIELMEVYPTSWAWKFPEKYQTFEADILMAITKRQRQVYEFIEEFMRREKYSPSFDEIRIGLNLGSLATVHKHINNLRIKGLLVYQQNMRRTIELIPPKKDLRRSLLGEIAYLKAMLIEANRKADREAIKENPSA
jgi:LexA DNA binding domain-containing protein